MIEQERRMSDMQEIILKAIKKTDAVLDAIPDEGLNDRLECLGGFIMPGRRGKYGRKGDVQRQQRTGLVPA
ncbi:MAG: hypothetical protein MR021_06210 [Clostridiales bacterium]|nr:hypothetical protein [Clostridiales bacterium]